MSLENTLTTTSSSFHEEKDYFDIVDFIESTIELQEDNIKAQNLNHCSLSNLSFALLTRRIDASIASLLQVDST